MNSEFSHPRSWCHARTHSIRFSYRVIILNSSRLLLFVLLDKNLRYMFGRMVLIRFDKFWYFIDSDLALLEWSPHNWRSFQLSDISSIIDLCGGNFESQIQVSEYCAFFNSYLFLCFLTHSPFLLMEHWASVFLVVSSEKWKLLSCVWLFASPWTVALQAPQSMEFPRQENQSG